jgi:bisphosphoglycerate-dependent phosphoglycerate mutase
VAKKATRKTAGEHIVARKEFDASALTGRSYDTDTGRMSAGEAKRYKESNPTYTVRSYNTPIAWHGDKGWEMSSDKHSPTTSRHQSITRAAIFTQGHDGARQ